MSHAKPEAAAPAEETVLPAGQERVNGRVYLRNAEGGLPPIEGVKPMALIEDDLVRRLVAAALPLSTAIAAFRDGGLGDYDAYRALSAERFGAKVGGEKGGSTLRTFDGLMEVEIAVQDRIALGDELQDAKSLIDEYLNELVADSSDDLRTIVTQAFRLRKGKLDKTAILKLRTYNITDPRWLRAMDAINESIKVLGSKRYLRVRVRPDHQAAFRMVSLDAASA